MCSFIFEFLWINLLFPNCYIKGKLSFLIQNNQNERPTIEHVTFVLSFHFFMLLFISEHIGKSKLS